MSSRVLQQVTEKAQMRLQKLLRNPLLASVCARYWDCRRAAEYKCTYDVVLFVALGSCCELSV